MVYGSKYQYNTCYSIYDALAVAQEYTVDVFKTTVLLHNDALVPCVIPSHVGDMVHVVGWVDSLGEQFTFQNKIGNYKCVNLEQTLAKIYFCACLS